jgi:hypothetical protein
MKRVLFVSVFMFVFSFSAFSIDLERTIAQFVSFPSITAPRSGHTVAEYGHDIFWANVKRLHDLAKRDPSFLRNPSWVMREYRSIFAVSMTQVDNTTILAESVEVLTHRMQVLSLLATIAVAHTLFLQTHEVLAVGLTSGLANGVLMGLEAAAQN